jgi:hypothetical protein
MGGLCSLARLIERIALLDDEKKENLSILRAMPSRNRSMIRSKPVSAYAGDCLGKQLSSDQTGVLLVGECPVIR